jgi:hypothetical protein
LAQELARAQGQLASARHRSRQADTAANEAQHNADHAEHHRGSMDSSWHHDREA